MLVDRKHMLDLIDQLRVAIPANIKEARYVLQRREQAIAEAGREATRIVESAQNELDRRLGDTAVVRQAEERARQISQAAEEQARLILREAEAQAAARLAAASDQARLQQEDADRYALALLNRLDTQMAAFLSSVRQGIQSLQEPPDPPRGAGGGRS